MPFQKKRCRVGHRVKGQASKNRSRKQLRSKEKECSKLYQNIAQTRYQIDLIRPAFSSAQLQPPSNKFGEKRLNDLLKLRTLAPFGLQMQYDIDYVKTLIGNAKIELNDLKIRLTEIQATLADDSVATVDKPSSVATGVSAASSGGMLVLQLVFVLKLMINKHLVLQLVILLLVGWGILGGMLVLQLVIHNHLVLIL